MTIDIGVVVGRELRRLRLREGMFQEDVARALRIPRPVVSRRERGKHVMRMASVIAHARVVGGSLGHILFAIDVASGAVRP